MNRENLKLVLIGAILVVQSIALVTRPTGPTTETDIIPVAIQQPRTLDVRIVSVDGSMLTSLPVRVRNDTPIVVCLPPEKPNPLGILGCAPKPGPFDAFIQP